MKKEPRSFAIPQSTSKKTEAVREFFTAMLATVSLAAVGFGLIGKVTENAEDSAFSMKESSQETFAAKTVSREYAQDANSTTGEPTYYDGDVEPVPVDDSDLSNTAIVVESAYAELLAQLDAGETPSPELYVAAATDLLSNGAGSDAKAVINAALIVYPDESVVALGAADVRAATGDADSAWSELAQTGDVTNAEVMSRLIQYATVAGKVDETMAILGDLSSLPWTPSAEDWSNLVSMLTAAGRYEDAKTAVDLSPEKKTLKLKLEAIEKFGQGEFDKALEKLNLYVAGIETRTADDWALLAEIYSGLGRTAEADDAYQRAEGLLGGSPTGGSTGVL